MSDDWKDVPVSESDWKDVSPSDFQASTATQEAPKPTDTPYDPLNPSQGTSLINRAPAAAREALRSIGTGEDMADAYMRGLNNPNKYSETMQQGAIRGANEQIDKNPLITNLPEGLQTFARFREGMVPSAAGLATDIATNPKELLSIIAFERFPTLFKQIAPAISERIAKYANEKTLTEVGKDIKFVLTPKVVEPDVTAVKDLRNEILMSARDANTQLQRDKSVEVANLDQQHAEIASGLDTKLKTIDGKIELTPAQIQAGEKNIPIVADKATITLRNKYWDYAKDLYTRFGKKWDAAIAGEKIATQTAYDTVGNAIEKSGMLNKDQARWSDAEKAVYNLQQEYLKPKLPGVSDSTEVIMTPSGPQRQTIKTGQDTLSLSDFDKKLQSVLGIKKGQAYGSSEHVLTLVREEVTNALGQTASKLKNVKMEFAPEFQTKNELNKIVQPFNRSAEKDTTAGINFFSDYAQGKMTDPDKIRLIRAIQDNPKLGEGIIKPLDNMKLQRNIVLRNRLNLEINKPQAYGAIETKYNNLKDGLLQDVRMQNEVTKGMLERAQYKQDMAKKIKAAVGASVVGAEELLNKSSYTRKLFKF